MDFFVKKILNNYSFNFCLKLFNFVFFISFLLIGLNIYKDFGISLDEVGYRHQGITVAYTLAKYLNLDLIQLLPKDKEFLDIESYKKQEIFSGVPYHLLTIITEYLTDQTDKKEIFEFKHLNNFLFFFLSLFFFFKIIKFNLNKKNYSILGVIFLIFSPRIFAEIFYNPNDIPFMNGMIILTFFYLKFLQKLKIKYLIFSSILTGLCFGLRPMSIYMPFLLMAFIGYLFMLKKINFLNYLKICISFSFLCILFTYFLNPQFWNNPVQTIIEQFKWATNSNVAEILYQGKFYNNNETPWHYTLNWILITTPIVFIILFFFGTFSIFRQFPMIMKNYNFKSLANIFIFFSFFIPLFAAAVLSKSFLNGWRHLYFIYPYLIIFSTIGYETIQKIISKNLKLVFSILIILNLSFLAKWIYINHPHQMTYFNIIPGASIQDKYEMDYWNLSNKSALNYILKKDKRKKIKVANLSENRLIYTVNNMLFEKDRTRIKLVDVKDADYLISTYNYKLRRRDILDLKYKIFYEIKVDNNYINSIFYQKNLITKK